MQTEQSWTLGQQIFWFFGTLLGGAILSQLLILLLARLLGVSDMQHLIGEIIKGNYLEHVLTVKILSGIGHLAVYTCSAFAFAYLLKRKEMFKYLILNKMPSAISLSWVLLITISSLPVAMWVYYGNMQIIPDAWVAENTLELEKRLLDMNNWGDLVTNILVLGLIAGLGEELVFRGILMRLATQLSQNIHLGVWLAAIIFSLIHFQPEGFVPRMLLGAGFGYILAWTGNLWYPILAHIAFNSVQIVFQFIWAKEAALVNPQDPPNFSWALTLLSVAILILGALMLKRKNRDQALNLDNYYKNYKL